MQKKWVLRVNDKDTTVELNIKSFGGSWEVLVDEQSVLRANVKEFLQGKILPCFLKIQDKKFLIYPKYNFKARTYEISEISSNKKLVQRQKINPSEENLAACKTVVAIYLVLIGILFLSYINNGRFSSLVPLVCLLGLLIFQTYVTFRTVIFAPSNVFIKTIFSTKKVTLDNLEWFLCERNQFNLPLQIRLKFKGSLTLIFDYTQIYHDKNAYLFFEGLLNKLENRQNLIDYSSVKIKKEEKDAQFTRVFVTLLVISALSYFSIQSYFKSSEFTKWNKKLVEVKYKKVEELADGLISYSYVFKGEEYQKVAPENRCADRSVASVDPLYINPETPFLSFFQYEIDRRQRMVSRSINGTIALFIILGSLIVGLWYLVRIMEMGKALKTKNA